MKKHPLAELHKRGYVKDPAPHAPSSLFKVMEPIRPPRELPDRYLGRVPGLDLSTQACQQDLKDLKEYLDQVAQTYDEMVKEFNVKIAAALGVPNAILERCRQQAGRIWFGVDPGRDDTHVHLEWREPGPIHVVSITTDLTT